MNNKTGTIVAVSLIVVALVTSSYSLGWVNFGSRDPPLAPVGEKGDGIRAVDNRESFDSDDAESYNFRNSVASEYDVNDDDVKGGSRKRRRRKGINQSKKRSNKRSKLNRKKRNSRQISKKKK